MPKQTESVGRLPFDLDDVRAILGGMTEPKVLSERDRKGLSPVMFAALKAAAASDALLSLLDERPKEGENDPIQELRELLLALGQSVLRLEKKVDKMTRALGAGVC